MPIWGKLELLCRAISEEGKKEADRIFSQAEADADRVIAEAEDRAEKDFEGKILSKRGKAHTEAKRLVDSAELEARRRIMSFREDVMREVLERLEERLRSYRSEPSYADFLLHALRDGIEHLPAKQLIVELSQEDRRLIEDRIQEIAGELSVEIELISSSSLDGGVRVYTGDRRLLFDNSLSARLKRIENDLRQDIWREIFGTDR